MAVPNPSSAVTMGQIQSRGEDLAQYLNAAGKLIAYITGDGTHVAPDYVTPDGISLRQVSQAPFPTFIDSGTF